MLMRYQSQSCNSAKNQKPHVQLPTKLIFLFAYTKNQIENKDIQFQGGWWEDSAAIYL